MPVRRRKWKYVGSGRTRRRVYYFENVFGVDKFSLRTLRAVHTKMNRDYLKFFGTLSKLYGASKQKREIDDTINLIKRTTGVLDAVIAGGEISKEDADNLQSMISQIEERKQYFVEQSRSVKALQDRLDQVVRTTGLSIEDLNVTREIVSTGIAQARRAQREGVLPFMRRTMPGITELGRDIGFGAVTALAGPFTPILGVLKDIVTGIGGVGKGLLEKTRTAREYRGIGKIRPFVPREQREGVIPERGRPAEDQVIAGATFERARPVSEGMDLYSFFNKDAFRAKWTKQHLEAVKADVKDKKKASMLGGLAGMFRGLGTAIVPLIGKAGQLALLGAAVVFTTKQLSRLKNAYTEYQGSLDKYAESQAALARSQAMWVDYYKEKIGKEIPEIDKLSKEVTKITRIQETRERLLEAAPTTLRDPFAAPGTIPKVGVEEPATLTIPELGEMNKNLNRLIDELRQTQNQSIAPPESGLEKVTDSNDLLLSELANGNLSIGD